MDHSNYIKETCAHVFKANPDAINIVQRLLGGMSNFTYVIEVEGTKYTFRIPGKKAEKFVDRNTEAYHLELIDPLNLNNETVYTNVETGVKIAKYIEGTPMHELSPFDYLEASAKVLKTLHESGLKSQHDYAPFERLAFYESHLERFDFTHDAKYVELKELWLKYRPFLEQFEKTLAHGDSQVSNFVKTEAGSLRLMDWEFTGNNDPYYDIACFGNNNFDHAIALLPIYLDKVPTYIDYKRLYLWRVYQCLQWHNVALYKDRIGLSEDLKVPFDKVADMYLTKAEGLLAKLK